MVKESAVTWAIERMYCDECGEEMARVQEKLENGPPFEHQCKNGHKVALDNLYPALTYQDAENGGRLYVIAQ